MKGGFNEDVRVAEGQRERKEMKAIKALIKNLSIKQLDNKTYEVESDGSCIHVMVLIQFIFSLMTILSIKPNTQ